MRSAISTATEVVGLLALAVAIGALAGVWWGLLVFSVEAVLVGVALDVAPSRNREP